MRWTQERVVFPAPSSREGQGRCKARAKSRRENDVVCLRPLRAQRSNPEPRARHWIASSLALLAMTMRAVCNLNRKLRRLGRDARRHFAAEKRLSNEFDCTIGCAPATMASLAGGAAAGALACAAGASLTDGLSGGRLTATCLVSAGLTSAGLASAGLVSAGLNAFGSGFAAGVFGLGGGGAVAVGRASG